MDIMTCLALETPRTRYRIFEVVWMPRGKLVTVGPVQAHALHRDTPAYFSEREGLRRYAPIPGTRWRLRIGPARHAVLAIPWTGYR
jgi:hypothetical protein